VAEQYRITGGTAIAISSSVEEGVRRGALPADAALPTVRALAAELAVSPATVSAAYQRLRQRGIVLTAGRHGTRVRSATPIAVMRFGRLGPVPHGVRDLMTGEPDPALLPSLSPALQAVAAELAAGAPPMRYSTAGPLPELLALARQRMPELPDSASYTVVAGALDGMDRLFTARLRPGDRVAVEDPGWAALLDLLAAHGLVPVSMRVDSDGPTEAGVRAVLASGVSAVIVTARAQNPTGAAISSDRARALRPLLRDTFVIEDDHAAELAGLPLHPLVGSGASWAFLRSVSKPYGPDLRCAVLAGDAETVSRVEGRLRLDAGWVSSLLQRTVVQLWRSPEVAEAITAAGRTYDERRNALITAFAQVGVTATGRTGINVWVPVPDETQAVSSLRDAGYAVAPGHLYRIASPPAIRITIAGLTDAEVQPLAEAVAAALAPLTRGVSR
jgi:DNA-binding transcriptional MocR family regulator